MNLLLCVVDKSHGSFMRSEYTEARNRWGGVMRSIVLFPDRRVLEVSHSDGCKGWTLHTWLRYEFLEGYKISLFLLFRFLLVVPFEKQEGEHSQNAANCDPYCFPHMCTNTGLPHIRLFGR